MAALVVSGVRIRRHHRTVCWVCPLSATRDPRFLLAPVFAPADSGNDQVNDSQVGANRCTTGSTSLHLNSRAVGTESAQRTADRIASKSPIALAATLYSLRHKESDLADTLRREFRVSLRFLQHPDMAEGIRAQVIDKDRNPVWTSDHESALASIDAVFAALPADTELLLDIMEESNV